MNEFSLKIIAIPQMRRIAKIAISDEASANDHDLNFHARTAPRQSTPGTPGNLVFSTVGINARHALDYLRETRGAAIHDVVVEEIVVARAMREVF
nr:hypothetical protein [Candidatus Sigynarchaeota archaeon]